MGNISQTPFIPTPPYLATDGIVSANANGTGAVVAGAAYLSPITVFAPVTVTQIRASFSGSPTGNVDMGIYDSSGSNGLPNNRLGSTGANVAATGLFTKNLTANLLLSPGNYWIAFLDTVADALFSRTGYTTGLAPALRTTATNLTVLPASIGTVANGAPIIDIIALLQNSWS
ncbi:MAG TPA: hypothetical protein VHV10_02275 [Ktedonobacteraceae bacterium]|jgi:hypothetical protein|nr:hypothetical protein [Ktedonobacteraceae bacterium]